MIGVLTSKKDADTKVDGSWDENDQVDVWFYEIGQNKELSNPELNWSGPHRGEVEGIEAQMVGPCKEEKCGCPSAKVWDDRPPPAEREGGVDQRSA